MNAETTKERERNHDHIVILKSMVRGAYDLQALRMQCGLRLCANFRAKLGLGPKPPDTGIPQAGQDPDEFRREQTRENAEAEKVIDQLRASYRRLTDGIARNRRLPAEKGFEGDGLISNYAELVLADGYFRLESEERSQFNQLELILGKIDIYNTYLTHQRGIGPALAGVLISCFDPYEADYVSSFWKYSGLDVGPDGRGRSRREAHLVAREYIDRHGKPATRRGITYDPWLKSKLMGVLAPSMLRLGSPWREQYDNYRHRIESDPARIKLTVDEWKKRRLTEDEAVLWTPGRIHMASARYMVKMFLLDFWKAWRRLEGLPVPLSYNEARRGRPHGGVHREGDSVRATQASEGYQRAEVQETPE